MRKKYLYDIPFLKELYSYPVQTKYIEIISLDRFDKPIAFIKGRATGGSININGASAIRRTANISLIADNDELKVLDIQSLIAINKRIEIQVGLENKTNKYSTEDIIWFPMGVYYIIQPSISINSSGTSISLSLKDKMAGLNGECGGIIPVPAIFSPLEDENGELKAATFFSIIHSVVVEYGDVPEDKVIIDGVPLRLKQTARWVGNKTIYLSARDDNQWQVSFAESEGARTIRFNENLAYQYIDFTYPTANSKEFSCAAGDTVVSVLDKIKSAMGNYEYFFDVDGYFHFQEIKNYQNEGEKEFHLGEALDVYDYFMNTGNGKSVYSFEDNFSVTQISSTPQFTSIKNDITIWGQTSDKKAGLRFHLLLDTIPLENDWKKEYLVEKYKDDFGVVRFKNGNNTFKITPADYRTALYIKAVLGENYSFAKELIEEWPKICDITNSDKLVFFNDLVDANYYFEILDTDNIQVSQFNISSIGRREKVINNKEVNCIFANSPMDIVLIKAGTNTTASEREEAIVNNENFIQMDASFMNNVSTGIATYSAYEALRSVLHQYLGYAEGISISTVPIYHLEPNTRVSVFYNQGQIYGDYVISSLSIPLDISGVMSIKAAKAIERI